MHCSQSMENHGRLQKSIVERLALMYRLVMTSRPFSNSDKSSDGNKPPPQIFVIMYNNSNT